MWPVSVERVLTDQAAEIERFVDWGHSTGHSDTLVIASTASVDAVAGLQAQFGADNVSAGVENFLATAAKRMVDDFGVRRLVVAGGETSGAVLHKLGVRLLRIGPEICTGVPWTETINSRQPLALAFKSGNFGDVDFFKRALEMLA